MSGPDYGCTKCAPGPCGCGDEAEASVRWWHCLLGHRWTRWREVVLQHRDVLYGIAVSDWEDTRGQERECSACGKVQIQEFEAARRR